MKVRFKKTTWRAAGGIIAAYAATHLGAFTAGVALGAAYADLRECLLNLSIQYQPEH